MATVGFGRIHHVEPTTTIAVVQGRIFMKVTNGFWNARQKLQA